MERMENDGIVKRVYGLEEKVWEQNKPDRNKITLKMVQTTEEIR